MISPDVEIHLDGVPERLEGLARVLGGLDGKQVKELGVDGELSFVVDSHSLVKGLLNIGSDGGAKEVLREHQEVLKVFQLGGKLVDVGCYGVCLCHALLGGRGLVVLEGRIAR